VAIAEGGAVKGIQIAFKILERNSGRVIFLVSWVVDKPALYIRVACRHIEYYTVKRKGL
jgi:hypothetical protein